MSIHWAQAAPVLWFLLLPSVLFIVGGYVLLALRQRTQYGGYGEPADVVDSDGDKCFVFELSLPFLALIGCCVGLVRTWGGLSGLGQLLVTPHSSSLSLGLVIALCFLLSLLGGQGASGGLLRYGLVGAHVFVFWAWSFLVIGVHATNVLGYFIILELFNTCALLVLALEGASVTGATKGGFVVVSEAVLIFFWISVFSTFSAFWGLGLLVSLGVSLGGVVRLGEVWDNVSVTQQLLLSGGMGLKGGVPPLGWWVFEFYGGLTADQLATYISAFYVPLFSLALCVGFGFSGGIVALDQLQRQGIAVGAVGLTFSVLGIRTIRSAIAVSTVVSLALVGSVFS